MAFADLLASADRAVLTHMGSAVTYTTAAGTSAAVTGIFDAAYVKADAGQAGVVSSGPAVFLRLADLPSDPEEDEPTIAVAGVDYRVREPQADGMGGVLLLLHRK